MITEWNIGQNTLLVSCNSVIWSNSSGLLWAVIMLFVSLIHHLDLQVVGYNHGPYVGRFQNLSKMGESLMGKNSETLFGQLDIGISQTVRGNHTVLVIFIHPSE